MLENLTGQLEPDDWEVFAEGVRNSIGFDFSPTPMFDGTFWFTDNGRDNWGDDRPPCELNHAPQAGMHFGYPYCHGDNDMDSTFNSARNCDGYTPIAVSLGGHVAPLGMKFYTGDSFPAPYNSGIFLVEHGSWNRNPYSGYRVMHVHVDPSTNAATQTSEPILEGMLVDGCSGSRIGRPSDVDMLPDG